MIRSTVSLDPVERVMKLEVTVYPDTTSTVEVYQDFLAKFEGELSVDVNVLQEKDINGEILYPGHARILISIKDADDPVGAPKPSSGLMDILKASLVAKSKPESIVKL